MAKGWEYATITQDGGREKIEVHYANAEHVAHHDAPAAALPFVLGALGSKEWELVSVTASWSPDSHYVTQYFLKRPHEGHWRDDELADLVRAAAWSSGLARTPSHE
ncbi:MAG TPA: hypothetical protein VH482_36005 [Thermomicrobiales bacterium]|jgi:hypothetical protein